SSTLFLLMAVVHLLAAARRQSDGHAVTAGAAVGLCYLTYSSSYLAIPLLAPFCLLAPRRHGRLVARGAAAAGLVLLPFVVYAARWHNYFGERTAQVGG